MQATFAPTPLLTLHMHQLAFRSKGGYPYMHGPGQCCAAMSETPLNGATIGVMDIGSKLT